MDDVKIFHGKCISASISVKIKIISKFNRTQPNSQKGFGDKHPISWIIKKDVKPASSFFSVSSVFFFLVSSFDFTFFQISHLASSAHLLMIHPHIHLNGSLSWPRVHLNQEKEYFIGNSTDNRPIYTSKIPSWVVSLEGKIKRKEESWYKN